MIRRIPSTILLASSLILAAGCGKPSPESATLVLTNASVYTADAGHTVSEALAVRDDTIVYVGTSDGAAAFVGEDTVVRDLGGAMVMPGLHDMHIHALGIVEPDSCDLKSVAYSLAELVPVLQACIEDHDVAPGEWLIVLQWAFSQGNQPGAGYPNMRAALDAVSTEHPIFLYGDDGHHGAANSLAFAMAKTPDGRDVPINAETLAAEYADFRSMFGLDAQGEPTGGVNEEARLLIRASWFEDMLGMSGDLDDTLSRANAKLAANGITTIQDAIVTPDTLAAYGRLEERGEMTFRFRAAMAEPPDSDIGGIDAHLAALTELRDRYADYELVHADGVKLFADAVLEGNPLTAPPTLPVAATIGGYHQPIFGGSIEDGSFDVVGYVDPEREVCQQVRANPGDYTGTERIDSFVAEYGFYPVQCHPQSGTLARPEEFLRAYIRKATEAGFHVHVHALSDKAVQVVVDELAKVKDVADRNGTSQSLAHVQLAAPADQARIGELGISVVFTFVWATPGLPYDLMVIPFVEQIDGIADLYDPDSYYLQNVYPAKTIEAAGGNLVNGSDAPVGSRDPMPFVSLQQAVFRSDGETVLNADQRIDIHSAIAAFTINGARLFGHDDTVGTLEVGKKADLIALDRNIVDLAESGRPYEIGETQVTLTVFDGDVVYEAASD